MRASFTRIKSVRFTSMRIKWPQYRMAVIREAFAAAIEGMTNGKDSDRKRDAYVDFLAVLLAFILAFVILGFVGKLLWNSVVVELLTIAKPAKSFWQIVGFMIFVALIHP